MTRLRHVMRRHPSLLAALFALVLAMKLVVPAGYMPTVSAAGIDIVPCSGMGPVAMAKAMPGMAHHHADPADDGKSGGDRHESPCTGAGLNVPVLSGADPFQLAIALALAIVVALALTPPPPPRSDARLRPPLRGPPHA